VSSPPSSPPPPEEEEEQQEEEEQEEEEEEEEEDEEEEEEEDGGDGNGCFASGTPVLMANRSARSIEHVKPGDSILSRDQATGHLVPDVVVSNRSSKVSAIVILELSTGKVLEVSARQPLVLHDGRLARAWDVARRARIKTIASEKDVVRRHARKSSRRLHWRDIPSPIRLRTHTENEIQVVSSRIVKGTRTVHCIETQHKRLAFMLDAEVTTDPIEKQ
jgi:hypothetical protein